MTLNKLTAILLSGILALSLTVGCSGQSAQSTSGAGSAAAPAEEAAAEETGDTASAEETAEEAPAAEETTEATATEGETDEAVTAEAETDEAATAEAATDKATTAEAATDETTTDEAAEGAPAEETAEAATDEEAASEDEIISEEDLKAVFEKAQPYEDDIQVVFGTSSGDVSPAQSAEGQNESGTPLFTLKTSGRKYNTVRDAAATSTLYVRGYNYSVWNLVDRDAKTCWAEGNPRSEGVWEGFAYGFGGRTRVDGFRIYPGYQKNVRVYRNNIVPLALQVELGGYEFFVNLDHYLQNLRNDGDYYWIDFYFPRPVYADSMYVMIGAVTTFGSDPDYD